MKIFAPGGTESFLGTVTTVSVVTANGVSGSVANPTTTPAITLTLGAITPTSVTTSTIIASVDSTDSMDITKANGTTSVMSFDTTNSRVGINITSPAKTLTVGALAAQNVIRVNGDSTANDTPNVTFFRSGVTEWGISVGGNTTADLNFVPNVSGSNYSDTNIGSSTVKTLLTSGRLGLGNNAPTAVIHLKAGTSSASTAPLKFTSGALLTSAEAGAMEFLSNAYYLTVTTNSSRQQIVTDTNVVTLTSKTLTSSTNVLGGVTMGLGSDAVGDIYSATTNNVLSRIAAVATGQVLISNGVTTLPSWSASPTVSNLLATNNAITASGNAATVPVTSLISTVTNNSAATLTITITTTNATNRQRLIVCVLDATGAAQTIAWVNTENSTVSVPTTSNGSTTLPLTVGFMYNSATSKWRCVASA